MLRMLVGEQRVIIQGRDGLLRHVFEVDENGQRRLRSTEVIQEAIPKLLKLEQSKNQYQQ